MTSAERALARGDVAAAEQLCQSVLAAAPEDGRPWSILAETALRRGRPDAAIVCATRAVALRPADPVARIMRAKCLALAGDAPAALGEAEAAARLGGASAVAQDGAGAVFGMLGRHRRALELFRASAAARPDHPQVLYNLAATERMLGELDAAETHCDQAIALDPQFYRAYHLRADLRIQTEVRNHVAEMETLVAAGARPWQGEVLLRYALGKECEDLGEHRRAFRHFKAGAELQRRNMRYDVRSDIALIDAIIASERASAVRPQPAEASAEAPIFIVGLPRSGTTLVERIVAGHSAVAAAGELGCFPLALARLAAAATETERSAAALVRRWRSVDPARLGRAYLESVRVYAALPHGRFIDKLPANYLHCGLLRRALPAAKIVLLRRAPMDSCYALYRALFQDTNGYSYSFDELAAYFAAFHRLAAHWQAILPETSFLEVAYESVVHDLPGTARRLLAFLDLPWEEGVLRFHASVAPSATASAVQIRRPLYSSSVGKWRHVAAELAPLRAALTAHNGSLELD